MTDANQQTRPDKEPAAARPWLWGLLALDLPPLLLGTTLAAASMAAFWFAATFEETAYPWLLETWPELERICSPATLPPQFFAWQAACGLAAAVWMAAALAGLIFRRGWALWAVRLGCVVAYLLVAVYFCLVLFVTGQVADAVMAEPEPPPGGFMLELFYWRCQWLAPAACLAVLSGALHVLSWRRAAVNLYRRRREASPGPGDRVIENLRTHGSDPRFRKSFYGSSLAHLLVIVLIPLLLTLRGGCRGIRPFRDPLGSGKPAVAMMKMVRPKKKVKRKRYILSKDSPIIFDVPDLDESKLDDEVEQQTRDQYVADTSAVHGAMGTGGGNQGGFFDGSLEGEIRFARLQYDDPDWDDGMDDADANFLARFQRLSGLRSDQVARRGESLQISQLRDYPKGEAPRFVYMTGSERVNLSENEIRTLSDYIKQGGMIFADAGSRKWDGEFRNLANNRLLLGLRLTEISDDDPIFRFPFEFPNGPPPLWFHGGKQTMGLKYRNRWVVFYFPGDLNDAWKTGHSRLDPDLAEAAFHVGVNVVYYATVHYSEETRKYRK